MTIYTAIFGEYDDLKEPLVVTPGWRYVCYTDQNFYSDIWEIKKVHAPSPILESKRHKILAPIAGPSIYIDGTFIINCDLNVFYSRLKGNITFIQHPVRKCVYAEALACIKYGKITPGQVASQINRYRQQGLPIRNGMAASGIILRNGEYDNGFCDLWWHEFNIGCNRDQISWAYANWKIPGSHIDKYHYGSGIEFLHIPHLYKTEKRKKRYKHYEKMGLIKLDC
jgi:hypothetical protein